MMAHGQTVLHGAVLFTPGDRPERFAKLVKRSLGKPLAVDS